MDTNATMAERLRVALDLFEAGTVMMRQTLRRRHPDATSAHIDALLMAWLEDRPGAPHGDGHGTRRPLSDPS